MTTHPHAAVNRTRKSHLKNNLLSIVFLPLIDGLVRKNPNHMGGVIEIPIPCLAFRITRNHTREIGRAHQAHNQSNGQRIPLLQCLPFRSGNIAILQSLRLQNSLAIDRSSMQCLRGFARRVPFPHSPTFPRAYDRFPIETHRLRLYCERSLIGSPALRAP